MANCTLHTAQTTKPYVTYNVSASSNYTFYELRFSNTEDNTEDNTGDNALNNTKDNIEDLTNILQWQLQ